MLSFTRMTASQILAPLANKSPEDLLEDVRRVREAKRRAEEAEAEARARRQRLEAEEAALTQLLAFLRSLSGEAASSDASQTEFAGIEEMVRNQGEPTKRQVPKRGPIMELMREQPEREGWTPREVRDALASRGIEGTVNLIRVTLRRMEDAGQLARLADGRRYTLASKAEAEDMGVG
jgi:hypothetical protein